jgi:hypothetical protein
VGEVSAPLETDLGYHIVEVLSRDEDAEVVEARHVLLPIAATDAAEVRLLTRADSLETLAQSRPLREAATAFGLTVREAEIAEDFANLPGVGVVSEGQDWAFVDDEGAGVVSPVFETDQAFYIVELVDESPAGSLSLDQVAQEIREGLQAERKLALTIEEANGWAAELRSGSETMEGLAERLGTELRTEGPFTRQQFVPGLGQTSPAIGAAFGARVGEVADPVATLGQVVVLRVDDRSEADRETWEAQKETQRTQVTASIQQARLDQWLEGLRTTVNILDNRAAYFEAAEEQAAQGLQTPMFF